MTKLRIDTNCVYLFTVQYPANAETSEVKLLTALQLLFLLLTPSHRSFLQRLLRLLRLVADNESSNRMSPDTLATMFTPHLLCPRKVRLMKFLNLITFADFRSLGSGYPYIWGPSVSLFHECLLIMVIMFSVAI